MHETSFELEYLACIHKLEAIDGKNLATFYLMNTSRNRNRWGVTDKALTEALPTIQLAPLGLDPNYQGVSHPDNPLNVGTFVKYNKPNGYATVTAEIDDPKAWQLLQSRKLGPISVVINSYRSICSSCGAELKSESEAEEHPCIKAGDAYEQVESFKFTRVDFVRNPAYPQAGILQMGAQSEAILNPITLCASAYQSQFQTDKGSGFSLGTKTMKTREGQKMDKTTEQLQAELDKANETIENMKKAHAKEIEKLQKPEGNPELNTLKADLKKTQEELDTIKKATHEKLLSEAIDKRFEAGLIAKKEDERKRIAEFSDDVLKMMAADAGVFIARSASVKPGPRTQYAAKEEGSELVDAMQKRAAELGLNPEMGLSTKTKEA